MAKEIPYFKFFTGEWSNGDITAENYKTQGVFINICAIYWTKEGDVSENFIRKKIKDNKCINELIYSDIIKVENESILISFLDEQLIETENIRRKNSDAGKESARKRALNKRSTPVQHPLDLRSTESQPLREEKRREEKTIEDKEKKTKASRFTPKVDFNDSELNELINEHLKIRKEKKKQPTEYAYKLFLDKLEKLSGGNIEKKKQHLREAIESSWITIYPLKNNYEQSTINNPKLSVTEVYRLNHEQNAESHREILLAQRRIREAKG